MAAQTVTCHHKKFAKKIFLTGITSRSWDEEEVRDNEKDTEVQCTSSDILVQVKISYIHWEDFSL